MLLKVSVTRLFLVVSGKISFGKLSGDWTKDTISETELRALLSSRIDQVNMDMVYDQPRD